MRRVLGAYGAFGVGEFGIWLTLLLYAYRWDGATGTTVVVLVQLVPSTLVSPYCGSLADRRSPVTALRASYAVQAVALGAMAAVMARRGPFELVLVLAAVASVGLTLTRPAQGAILPWIARSPEELTTANVLSGWTDGVMSLIGPAAAGVAVALGGTVTGVILMAGVNMVAVVLVPGRGVVPSATRTDVENEDEPSGGLARVRSSFATPATRLLLVFCGFYYLLIGALDVICVVLAVSLLHLGQGAAGYLNAAIGGGATVAGVVTVMLAGRPHLSRILAASLVLAVGALAALGGFPTTVGAFVLLAVIGLSGGVFSTVARTLLQRVAPPDAAGGAFAVLEGVMSLGLAAGAIVVKVGITAGGLRAALFAPAVVGLLLVILYWSRLRALDRAATVPQVQIRLLRTMPIFAPLATPVVEGVARQLQPVPVPAGTTVVREGEEGDRYFAVADGVLSVTRAGHLLRRLGRGDGFGEIALVAGSRRTATVVADTDALVYALGKEPFVHLMTGHPSSDVAAHRVVAAYRDPDISALGEDPPPIVG